MENEVKEKKLSGVGGWLLLFIISLIILNPIAQLCSVGDVPSVLSNIPEEASNLRNTIIVDNIVGSIVVLFGAYVGICLWRVKYYGVKIAKIFFVINTAYIIIIAAFYTKVIAVSNQNALQTIIRTLAYNVIWYFYLTNSERVKNTYIKK
jgi:hypothetical protein